MTDPVRVSLFDFTGGLRNKRRNPLNRDPTSLDGGLNIDLSNGILTTRPGYTVVSTGSLPTAEVMAMCQSRFPTNETSFVLAQVKDAGIAYELPESQSPPGSRIYHYAAYDPENGYIWVFGGTDAAGSVYYNDLWYWDIDNTTWHQVTDATDHPTWSAYGNDMVYDPLAGRLIFYVGKVYNSGGDLVDTLDEFWQYQIATNTFSKLADNPCAAEGTFGWRQFSRMILRENQLWLLGGNNTESAFSVEQFQIYDISSDTAVDVAPSFSGDGPGGRYLHAIAYNADDDAIMVVGGETTGGGLTDAWLLDIGADTYTQLDDLPMEVGDYFAEGGLCYCSGRYYAIGTANASSFGIPGPLLADVSWVYTEGSWETPTYASETLFGRAYNRVFAVGTDIWSVLGESLYVEDIFGGITLVEGAEVFTDMCSYTPGGTAGGASTSKLYASKDHLPTTTATFTQIYDLGDADRCTFAVLNDRVVITEGKANGPLVWGGCMETDGADWMYPKNVLSSQDGTALYDISYYVLDKDVDNVASVGEISNGGFIAICCDMPTVEAFYIEVESPNTGVSSGETSADYSETSTFAATSDFLYEDYRATITNWVNDGGSTGHFTDGASAVSLGTGNTAPFVEIGCQVDIDGTAYFIYDITGDGTGSGAVTLGSAVPSNTVDDIVGAVIGTGGLTLPNGITIDSTLWTNGSNEIYNYPIGAYALRIHLSGSELSGNAAGFIATLKTGDITTKASAGGNYLADVGGNLYEVPYALNVLKVTIAESDAGTPFVATTTPVEITFPSEHSATFTMPGVTKGSNAIAYTGSVYPDAITTVISTDSQHTAFDSNLINMALDTSKEYVIEITVLPSYLQKAVVLSQGSYRWPGPVYPKWYGSYTAGAPVACFQYIQTLYLPGLDLADYDTSTDWVAYLTGSPNFGAVAIQNLDSGVVYDNPTQLSVFCTSDASRFDVSSVESFSSITMDYSTPTDTSMGLAFSFDDRSTFWVYKSSAWREIVKYDTHWQYRDSASTWTNSSPDTYLGALKQAFGYSQNYNTAAEAEAINSTGWYSTNGILKMATSYINVAGFLLSSVPEKPSLLSITWNYTDIGGRLGTSGYTSLWVNGSGWTDGTEVSDVPLAQTGIISYDGTGGFTASYYVLDGVPGYWYKITPERTSSNTTITRIMYKAPCQLLSNIGAGQPDTPLCAIFHDTSLNLIKDLTLEVSNATGSFIVESDGTATYQAGQATIPMETTDYLYIGYLLTFGTIEVTPYDDNNQVVSALSAEYWTGQGWKTMFISDGTAGADGKTFSQKGRISWSVPSDWKEMVPLNANFPRGYYVRFSVSVNLTSTAALDEISIYGIPNDLPKYKYVSAFRDRIALAKRPDAADQVDISRPLEEYGMLGEQSGSYRVGGTDSIQCLISAWNGLFLGKNETWHQLLGTSPADFYWQGVEASRSVPMSQQSCIKAPATGIGGDGNRNALFFINRHGAWSASGLQVDSTYNSSRSQVLSELTNWWSDTAVPRLDLNNLHLACGEYFPAKNWLVWSVPMIVTSGQTEQTTNNRLIVYDLGLGAWLPPFDIAVSAMCQGYAYNSSAAGHIGPVGLYAGTYNGKILRLFSGTDDAGTDITWNLETGWLHLGSPSWYKQLRYLWVYGNVENNFTMSVYVDGEQDTPSYTDTISGITGPTGMYAISFMNRNIHANFVNIKLNGTGTASIYGMEVDVIPVRDTPGGVTP